MVVSRRVRTKIGDSSKYSLMAAPSSLILVHEFHLCKGHPFDALKNQVIVLTSSIST